MPESHIIIIDGAQGSGRKMLCLELALALLYNNQKTALLLAPDSLLRKTLSERKKIHPALPSPQILTRDDYMKQNNNFDAIIIPETSAADELAVNAGTYITIIPKDRKNINRFYNDTTYVNAMWELKKKIAATHKRSLNWIVCENNTLGKNTVAPSPILANKAKICGYRLAPPLANRKPYFLNATGISPQDKSLPELKNQMNYEDICAKREVIKLAEFIFNA